MKGNSGFSLLLAFLLGIVAGLGAAHAGGGVAGTAKADRLDVCVEPTDVMRRRHFDFIKHQRDITVHEGIRKTDHSLAGCVDCHVRMDAKGEHVPIDASGEFCAACHEYTGATLDCFSCHAAKPTGSRE